MAIKLVSVNIEGNKHLDTVAAFLEREDADVVCLMEVRESDLASLLANYSSVSFTTNARLDDGGMIGVCIASHKPQLSTRVLYADNLEPTAIPDSRDDIGVHRPVVQLATIDGIQLGVTHFTWTPMMSETDQQKAHVVHLIEKLRGEEMVLVGDFNIPRGNSTYQKLAEVYVDNIPAEVTTTIDSRIHRVNQLEVGKLAVVVDYIWTTPVYKVSKVRVEQGVSDHCAVVCEIEKI